MLMRSRVLESRAKPVTNLATNPSFETAVAGSTIVRRNLAPMPIPAGDNPATFGWGYGGLTNPLISTPTVGGPVVSGIALPWRKIQATQDQSTAMALYTNYVNASPVGLTAVTPLRTITASIYAIASTAGLSTFMRFRWFDASFAPVTTTSSIDPWTTTAATWRRYSGTVVVPATAVWVAIDVYVSIRSWLTGEWFGATGALAEERPALLPFFHGGFGTLNGIAYSYEGTANASPSVAKAAVVEVRRNLLCDPAVTTPSEWANDANMSRTPIASGMQVDIPSYAGDTAGRFYNQMQTAVTTGSVHSAAMTVSVPTGYPALTVSLALRIYTADSSSTQINGPSVTIQPGTTVVLKAEGLTAPSNAVGGQVLIQPASLINGTTYRYVVGLSVVEVGVRAGDPFSGSVTSDADLVPGWLSTVNQSASTLSGVSLGQSSYGGKVVRSWSGGSRGDACARFISATAAAASEAMFFGAGVWNNLQVMQPGRTYTALVKLRLAAALPAVDPTYSLRVGIRAAGPTNRTVYSSPAPNAPGSTVLRVTATIPSDATSTMVQLNHYGIAGGSDTFWDELAIVEGVYTGPYLDGDMPNCVWRGTPHVSQSVGYAAVA